MYEFIILAQLMHGPAHGYLIAKIINDMIGPFARISPGRLYPLLAKLEQNGLIAALTEDQRGQQGDRQMHIYQITEAGQMRFQILMRDTSSNPGEYQRLFAHKVTAFRFISPAERLRLIEHYSNYCQAHIFHLQGEMEDLARDAAVTNRQELVYHRLNDYSLKSIFNVMQHSIDQWQLELRWANSLREREKEPGD